MNKVDPIRESYYNPLAKADKWSDWLFIVISILSIGLLMISRSEARVLYDVLQSVFIGLVLVNFLLSLSIRLYLTPRAEDKRRQDQLSTSFDVDLLPGRTTLYYNNELADPIQRLAATTLENTLYSKTILIRMLKKERIRAIVFLLLFLTLILNRTTDLGMAATAAAAIFSEQVVARWLRMEWFLHRCESTHDALFTLLLCRPALNIFSAKAIELMTYYESSKTNAGILLSERIFEEVAPELRKFWEQMKVQLGIHTVKPREDSPPTPN